MFASIITFAKNAVTKYKAQRVKDVVTQYVSLADAQVVMTVPVARRYQTHRGVAQGHRGLDDGRQ